MLERLVLKNGVECTSQRLKWTSGARVMTCSLAVRSGGLGGEAPQGSRGVWGAAGPPMTRRQANIIIPESPLGQLESYHNFQNRDHHHYYS